MHILGYIYYLSQTMAGGRPSHPAIGEPGILDTAAKLAREILAAFRRWHVQYQIESDLAGLSDRALQDIGVHRGEISEVAEALARQAEMAPTPAPQRRVQTGAAGPTLAGCG